MTGLVAGVVLLPCVAEPARVPPSKGRAGVESIRPEKVGEAARFRSFGASGAFYRLREVRAGSRLSFLLEAGEVALLQPDSLRLFHLDRETGRWEIVSNSRYEAQQAAIVATVRKPGTYTVVGASRFEEVFEMQKRLCGDGDPGSWGNPAEPGILPEICKLIDCPPDGAFFVDPSMMTEVPGGISPDDLGSRMGGICEQCLGRSDISPRDFPECDLPGILKPLEKIRPGILFPWPRPRGCFDASDGCRPGPYKIGQVAYDFPDEFDLIPKGAATPSYPDVDVRATVRYPAMSAGTGTPVAGSRRYPLVLFLHGNHATCSCSCSHSCSATSRVPNHLGYDYLLDILASWGFIAVSIDGFDVTCAWSPDMTDYEARGRLVLRHLEKWGAWDSGGSDPWGGLFEDRVDMSRIGLSGHSRGGEGVVAAEYINRMEGLGYDIKAVNAIAPTDQDSDVNYIPAVPYFLLLASADGDVWNLQGLRTYDRTSPTGATTQSEKSMLWVYGANHNFFNTVWTPSSGFACASDDGGGLTGRLHESLQRLVACQSIVPFFRLHLLGETGFRKLFRGEVAVEGLDGVEMHWSFQHPVRLAVDDFETGDDPTTNTLGGAVTTSGGFTEFDEFEFKGGGPDQFNSSFQHFTHGLVLGWNTTQTYETLLPVGQRDISAYAAVSLRVAQILDSGSQNPVDSPRTLRVSLRTAPGTVSNVDFDVAGIQSVPFPYVDNGGKTVLGTIRIPLGLFRNGSTPLPLTDIEKVIFEFRGTGLIALDDVQFTK